MLWASINQKIWGLKIDGFTVQLCQTTEKQTQGNYKLKFKSLPKQIVIKNLRKYDG